MLIPFRQEHLLQPRRYILDRSLTILFYFLLSLLETIEKQQLLFNGLLDNSLDYGLTEVHLCKDVLENAMDDVT